MEDMKNSPSSGVSVMDGIVSLACLGVTFVGMSAVFSWLVVLPTIGFLYILGYLS